MRDYTEKKFFELTRAIYDSGYKTYTLYQYYLALEKNNMEDRYFILRHDVDLNSKNALRMALIEKQFNIQSTYYFRLARPRISQPKIIEEIASMGHEIGYHYEHMSDAHGNVEKAKLLFEENLKKLRNITEVKTVCMHGRPFSKYDGRDFWNYYKLADFKLVLEPYINIDYRDKFYFTDTGHCWDNEKFNIRDIVKSKGNLNVSNTSELIYLINHDDIDKAMILTHSDNWIDNIFIWLFYKILFKTINTFKRLLKLFYNK